jgi:hypothetical protein
MKKNFIPALFFIIPVLLLSTVAEAQKFRTGLHAGINGSQIWGDHMSGFNKGGLLAGVFVDFLYKPKMIFSFEMNYTDKGSRRIIDEFDQNPGDWNLYRLSYLEVPLIYKYSFARKFNVELALACGYLVGQKYIDRYRTEVPDADFARKYDASAFLGVNYILGDFLVAVRLQSSFLTVGKGKSNPIWAKTNTGWINIVSSFDVRYYLPFGKDK